MSELKLNVAQSALLVMDFQIPIVERYMDGGVHACLLEKVFPRQAAVIDSVELIRNLTA